MACACSKNRTRATADGSPAPSGTYKVIVNGRQVYESTSKTAADTVAARFADATIVPPTN